MARNPPRTVTVHPTVAAPGQYGSRIAAAREYARLSRDQLAAAIEVSATTIGRWERDENPPPRRPMRQAIARACDVPEWFLETGFGTSGGSAGPERDDPPVQDIPPL